MIAAASAALAAWLLVSPPPLRRLRDLRGARTRRPPDTELVAAVVAGVGAVALLGWIVGGLAAVPVALVARRLVRGLESAAVRRVREQEAAALPRAVDLLVAVLHAGRPPAAAFALAGEAVGGPLGERLGRVAALITASGDSAQVWRDLSDDPAISAVARALRRAEEAGVSAVGVLGHVADDLRRTRVAELRRRAAMVGPASAAPLGLCFLPAFFLVGIVPTVIGLAGTLRW